MKSIGTAVLMGVGSIGIFGGAFVGFAAMSGTPLHQIAFVKGFVKAPEEPHTPHDSTAASIDDHATPEHEPEPPADKHESPDPKVLEGSIGVLGSFLLPSPMSATELSRLQQELHTLVSDAKTRLERIHEREGKLDEWEKTLDARFTSLKELQSALDKQELEVSLREEELKRDESAKSERDAQSWKELAKFFEEGDASKLVTKLMQFEPKEAVMILLALDDERASQLMNALPPDKYRAYLDAYRGQVRKP
jgi:vacuolar-type H+-ATPase subunit I/STV1